METKGCSEYIECLDILYPALNEFFIPDFIDLNYRLNQLTGWSIEVVRGLIEVEDFFLLLANKKFPSSTWIRKPHQLDYLEEPDMFHDIFGHVPLLANGKFSSFMQDFGKLGVEYIDEPQVVKELQRLYWFTIEFGLIRENGRKVFGAGICSSYGETNHSLQQDVEVIPFDLAQVISTEFRTDVVQTKYFELACIDELFESFSEYGKTLKEQMPALFV